MPCHRSTGTRCQILMLIVLPLALPACKGFAVSGAQIDPPPPSLTAPCDAPARLPAAAMTQAQVERAWARDRTALVICGDKHAGLVAWASGVVGAQ